MQYRIAAVGALALLVLLRGPALMSGAWCNAGMLALRDVLLAQVDPLASTYPVHGALRADAATVRAVQRLGRAVALNRDNLAARWQLGRAAIAAGDARTAYDALEPLVGSVDRNPMVYHDVLTAVSYGGRSEEVISLYDSTPPPRCTQTISDVVALAYLDLVTGGQGSDGTEDQREVKQWLELANALRPGDLYANYHLWRQAQTDGDLGSAAVYSRTLVYFPLHAVHPTDLRLLDYATDVMPALVADGMWGREKTLNVVSYLVWQHSEATGVERLLERLTEHYPGEPDWTFYLAELHHRRDDLGRAETVYRQVLAQDPNYAQAYLRIGMIYEERAGGRQRNGCKSSNGYEN